MKPMYISFLFLFGCSAKPTSLPKSHTIVELPSVQTHIYTVEHDSVEYIILYVKDGGDVISASITKK